MNSLLPDLNGEPIAPLPKRSMLLKIEFTVWNFPKQVDEMEAETMG
jgi:hypothetical protein